MSNQEATSTESSLQTNQAAHISDTGTTDSLAPPKILKPQRRTIFIMLSIACAGILAVLYAWGLWPFTSYVEVTSDAYIHGQVTVMAPQVNGYVAEVMARDFEFVKKGQLLAQIDQRIYSQHVEQAEAQLAAKQADLRNDEQSLAARQATLAARQAELLSAQAEYDRAKADELRVNELASRGSVSLRERDQIRATAKVTAANVKKAQAAIHIAQEGVTSVRVARASLEAQVQIAEAELHLAKIDLDHTQIIAPRDSQLSEISVQQGQYVAAGTQLFYLVPDELWLVANYKETQTYRMHPGQRVIFTVDALNDAALLGHVERLSPATGSEFSVLRSDNATGNFTKVVQRIPVLITIDPGQPLAKRLRPGMSVVTHVDTTPAAPTDTSTAP